MSNSLHFQSPGSFGSLYLCSLCCFVRWNFTTINTVVKCLLFLPLTPSIILTSYFPDLVQLSFSSKFPCSNSPLNMEPVFDRILFYKLQRILGHFLLTCRFCVPKPRGKWTMAPLSGIHVRAVQGNVAGWILVEAVCVEDDGQGLARGQGQAALPTGWEDRLIVWERGCKGRSEVP